MKRAVVIAFAMMSALLALACGDGGSVDDGGLIAIHRLDLEGMMLTSEDYVTPPASLLGAYPAVVAVVSGRAITGDALVGKQVRLEMARRDVGAMAESDAFPEEFIDQELNDVESIDPLEKLIDDELLSQAAERLGFLPSHEEAEQLAREAEEAFVGGAMQAENAEGFYELLRVMGWPDHDWASNENIVDTYRRGAGMTRLRKEHCEKPTSQRATALLGFYSGVGYDCSAFLALERARADIVYYVRWAD